MTYGFKKELIEVNFIPEEDSCIQEEEEK